MKYYRLYNFFLFKSFKKWNLNNTHDALQLIIDRKKETLNYDDVDFREFFGGDVVKPTADHIKINRKLYFANQYMYDNLFKYETGWYKSWDFSYISSTYVSKVKNVGEKLIFMFHLVYKILKNKNN